MLVVPRRITELYSLNMSLHPQHKMSGKRKRGFDEDQLHLVLEPPSVPVKKRRLGTHPCLYADHKNSVSGSVNGIRCWVCLDSGSDATWLPWSLAKGMGLITGHEPTKVHNVHLWDGKTEVDVVELKSVTVDLGGGVVVDTPA